MMIGYQKVGGLHFLRIGHVGFSFYATAKPMRPETRIPLALEALANAAVALPLIYAFTLTIG